MDQETAKHRYGEAISQNINRYLKIIGEPETATIKDGYAILDSAIKPKKPKNKKEDIGNADC